MAFRSVWQKSWLLWHQASLEQCRAVASAACRSGGGIQPVQRCKAVVLPRFGGPEVLQLRDGVNVPPVGAGQVLVKVHAVAINPLDVRIREGYGRSIFKPLLPLVLGRDLSGEVAAVGSGVGSFKAGDPVFGALHPTAVFGTYSEYTVAESSELHSKPENLSHREASAIPFAALTAWRAVRSIAGLRNGQRLMILGAGGAVGLSAIQLARAVGADVSCTCGNRSMEVVKKAGASNAIHYAKSAKEVKQAAQGKFDVVLDALGKPETEQLGIELLKKGGQYVTLHGETARLTDELGIVAGGAAAVAQLARKRLQYQYTHGVDYSWAVMRPDEDALHEIAKLATEGKLHIDVGKNLPLSQVVEAQALQYSKDVCGKVVLDVV